VKSPLGAGLITRLTVVSLVKAPLTALSVIVNVPVCVEPFVAIVSVELAAPLAAGVIEDGLHAVPEET